MGEAPEPKKKKVERCSPTRQNNRCKRLKADHGDPCRWCGRPPEHHLPDDLDLEIKGRARMATARKKAGEPLDDLDRKALDATAGTCVSWVT